MNMTAKAKTFQLAETSFAQLGYVQFADEKSLAQDLTELRNLLQNAMQLEHATIPPYLTMLYTLDDDVDWRIIETLRSVVVEEMLHFTLTANLLNAIGGTPAVDSPEFLPSYPARLPYDIDDIEVNLYGFSKNGIFQGMVIEHPKDVRPRAIANEVPSDMTIGEFYLYIESRLRAAVENHGERAIFCGDPQRQIPPDVFYYGGGGNVLKVSDLKSAVAAMKLITDQGEGTENDIWVVDEDELAHYFRFSQIYNERLYQKGDTVASGPTGDPFPVPWNKSVLIDSNAEVSDYPPGEVRDAIIRFNQRYCQLLGDLQTAFTGAPDKLMAAVVAMCALRDDFRAITANPFPGKELFHCAPTFEYSVVNHQPLGKQVLMAAPATAAVTLTDSADASADATASNEATLDQLQQAYSTGNLQLALSCMSDEVIWDISGPSECPYLGVFYGHEGFTRFWTLLGATVNFGSAGVEKSFFSGDQAMSYGGEQGTTKCGRVPYRYDWAIRYQFNEQHQITLMRQYFNPLNILSALKAAPYPVPAACPHSAKPQSQQQ
ncbi:TPA: ferritin-like domain-containing protein [Serratia fonticola]